MFGFFKKPVCTQCMNCGVDFSNHKKFALSPIDGLIRRVDLDPVGWDGKDPENTFRNWIRELEHWERPTSFPDGHRGIMVYNSFPRIVKDQLRHLHVGDQLYQANALSAVKAILLKNILTSKSTKIR